MATKEKPATTQAEYDKAFEDVKSGKIPAPSFNDMGPLPNSKSKPKDMSPLPKKDTSASTKKAAPKPDYEGEMGYSPEEMAEVEQARKRLAKQGIYKKGGMVKSSASKRADGCAVRGKTKGKMV